jgi:hypothetical protein
MAILEIPTRSGAENAVYTQRSDLDGRAYVLRFVYNQRETKWYVDLSDQDGVSIYAGIKLVSNFPLIRRVTDARRPPGELYVIDNFGQPDPDTGQPAAQVTDPGLDDLGVRHRLVYLDAEELGRD